MTELLFREDPYRKDCTATVVAVREHGVVVDRTVFYARGGGQPGDTGTITRADGETLPVLDTVFDADGEILHRLADDKPVVGESVSLEIDWARRYAHMRMHTGLHLLGAVVPCGVTGGNISADRSRLDFDMQEPMDKGDVEARLNALIDADHAVTARWISQAELQAQPELVRTLSVQPPATAERIRLLDIPGVDLQPCGGTHVASTSEIGGLRVAKTEKKGRRNRRVHIVFA